MLDILRAFACSLLFGVLTAQSTLQVGIAGGFPEVRDALAVAQPGDVLLVHPGIYAHFTVHVGVTIRAVIPGTVEVAADPALVPAGCPLSCYGLLGCRIEPPAGQEAHIVGLFFSGDLFPFSMFTGSQRLFVSGRVTFRDCVMESQRSPSLSITSNSSVHLQSCVVRCLMTGPVGSVAMAATSSRVSAVDSVFEATTSGVLGPAAVALTGSELHASGVTIRGALVAGFRGGAAVSLDASSVAWISDSLLVGASNSCAIAPASAPIFADRTTIVNGVGSCSTPVPGGARIGVRTLSPPMAGAGWDVTYHTNPNALVAVFTASSFDSARVPELLQPAWLPFTNARAVALLVADANGLASASWVLPSGPGVTDQRIWLQAISGTALPLQTSPVVGGVVR